MDEQAKQEFAARYGLPVWAITQAETPDDPVNRRRRLCESIAQRYGVSLAHIDPDSAAIRELAELMEKDIP